MARSKQHAVLALSASLLGACLVQDVELVDMLPGGGGSGSGGEGASSSGGMAGTPSSSGSQNEGGDPGTGAVGGEDTAGSSSGGTAEGGSGGSTGMAGSGGSGSPTRPEIPPNLLTCSDPTYYVCDTFEDPLSSPWPPGTAGQDVTDAPSGELGLVVNYNETHTLPVDLTAMSVSFWVRFPSPTDQRFLSFQEVTTLNEFGLGIEHERARWIYPDMAAPAVAPEQNSLTRILPIDTWVCVQVRADVFANTYDAMVVVPGDAPVTLPVLDKNPTAGEDESWNSAFPGWSTNSGAIIFGQIGVYQEIDDVLVAEYDAETLCEKFVSLDSN
jgi:hypothetical protein